MKVQNKGFESVNIECNFYPISTNDKYAIGLHNSNGKLLYPIQIAQRIESLQITKALKHRLYACKSQELYTHFFTEFMVQTKYDTLLGPIAENLCRDTELLEFRKSLPSFLTTNKEEKGNTKEEEQLPACKMVVFEENPERHKEEEGEEQLDDKFWIRLMIYRHNGKKKHQWKETNIVIPIKREKFPLPGVYLRNDWVLCASYHDEERVKVEIYDIANNYRCVFSKYVYGMKGPLSCAFNDNGWIAICDGFCVQTFNMTEQRFVCLYTIEKEIILCVNITSMGHVCIGTYGGIYYRVNQKGFVAFSERLSNKCAILSINIEEEYQIVVQTISSVYVVEGNLFENQIYQLNTDRPLSVKIHKDVMFILSKYGHLRIVFLTSNERKYDIVVPPPTNGELCFVDTLTRPWYHALHVVDDKKVFCMFPLGQIVHLNYLKK